MRSTCIAISFLLLGATAHAQLLDFEDLTVGDMLTVGGAPLVTDGVTITGGEFFWLGGGSTVDGFAEVQSGGAAGGSGNELWFNNINADFDFGSSIVELSLLFGAYGGNCNLEINGVLENFNDDEWLTWDGMVVGGVLLGVADLGGGLGELSLTGTIDQFAIGGQEFAIDDVSYTVPEPASLALLLLAGLMRRR